MPRGTIQPGTLALLKALHGSAVWLPPNHKQRQPLPRCSSTLKVVYIQLVPFSYKLSLPL